MEGTEYNGFNRRENWAKEFRERGCREDNVTKNTTGSNERRNRMNLKGESGNRRKMRKLGDQKLKIQLLNQKIGNLGAARKF